MKQDKILKLVILKQNTGVRLYGNRNFFSLLKEECARLEGSSAGDHAEFQTIKLNHEIEGYGGGHLYRAFDVDDDFNLANATSLEMSEFDIVFMCAEEEDLERIVIDANSKVK